MLFDMPTGMKRFVTLFVLTVFLTISAAPQSRRPPLSKDEVHDLLSSHQPGSEIAATIRKYGINFSPTNAVLEEFRASGADKSVLAALQQAWHPEIPKPLSATQIRMLVTAETPSENIVRLMAERGIDFQPTAAFLNEMRSDGAQDALIDALRRASPRPFSKEELEQLLGTSMDEDGLAQQVRQRGIDFEPVTANLEALRNAGAHSPLLEAVRTARREKPFVAGTPAVAALPPVVAEGKPVNLVCGAGDSDVPIFAVPDNLGDVATHLPCGQQVTFMGKVAAPPGVDKIRYGDGKEGYVADDYIGSAIAGLGADVKPPTAIYKPDPDYTPQAARDGIEGTIQFSVVVDTEGDISDIQEKSAPLGDGLDQSAIDTVKKWKFNPATRNGVPVPVRVTVEVSFRMRKAPK